MGIKTKRMMGAPIYHSTPETIFTSDALWFLTTDRFTRFQTLFQQQQQAAAAAAAVAAAQAAATQAAQKQRTGARSTSGPGGIATPILEVPSEGRPGSTAHSGGAASFSAGGSQAGHSSGQGTGTGGSLAPPIASVGGFDEPDRQLDESGEPNLLRIFQTNNPDRMIALTNLYLPLLYLYVQLLHRISFTKSRLALIHKDTRYYTLHTRTRLYSIYLCCTYV